MEKYVKWVWYCPQRQLEIYNAFGIQLIQTKPQNVSDSKDHGRNNHWNFVLKVLMLHIVPHNIRYRSFSDEQLLLSMNWRSSSQLMFQWGVWCIRFSKESCIAFIIWFVALHRVFIYLITSIKLWEYIRESNTVPRELTFHSMVSVMNQK